MARLVHAGRDALPIGILACAVIGVPVLMLEPQGMPRLRSLEKEVATVEEENHKLERDISQLRQEISLLRDDLASIEQVARSELGLVRKSEVVFQVTKP